MSKRGPKAPTPFFKTLPSVIRSFGPRLVIAAAACALLLLCTGGTYLLSHQTPSPTTKAPAKPVSKVSNDSSEAEVLGDSTPKAAGNPTVQATSNPQPAATAPAASPAETPAGTTSAAAPQTPDQASISASTSPKQTSVKVQAPAVGGLSLNLSLGL